MGRVIARDQHYKPINFHTNNIDKISNSVSTGLFTYLAKAAIRVWAVHVLLVYILSNTWNPRYTHLSEVYNLPDNFDVVNVILVGSNHLNKEASEGYTIIQVLYHHYTKQLRETNQ